MARWASAALVAILAGCSSVQTMHDGGAGTGGGSTGGGSTGGGGSCSAPPGSDAGMLLQDVYDVVADGGVFTGTLGKKFITVGYPTYGLYFVQEGQCQATALHPWPEYSAARLVIPPSLDAGFVVGDCIDVAATATLNPGSGALWLTATSFAYADHCADPPQPWLVDVADVAETTQRPGPSPQLQQVLVELQSVIVTDGSPPSYEVANDGGSHAAISSQFILDANGQDAGTLPVLASGVVLQRVVGVYLGVDFEPEEIYPNTIALRSPADITP